MRVKSESGKRRAVTLVVCGVFAAAVMTAATLRADDDDGPPIPLPHRVSQEGGATVVKLTPDEQARAGVRSAVLASVDLRPTVETFGSVEDVRDLIADQEAFALAQTKVESATAAVENALAEYRRAQALHQSGKFLSTEQLQAAEETWRLDDAALKAARISATSLRASLGRKWGAVIAGWIMGLGDELGALATGREVLVRVSIPDGVTVGNPSASCLLRSPGGEWIPLEGVSAATLLDPAFQRAAYYFLAPAGSGLVSGQTLQARLTVSGKPIHGVRVPSEAVVWWQGGAWTYVESKPGIYTRVSLAGAEPREGGGFFAPALKPGTRAVVAGADVLLSEETRQTTPAPDND